MHAQGMFASIDGQYAKPLGYEALVGGFGLIIDTMTALCTVTVLRANDTALIGKQFDIHKEDLKLQAMHEGEENKEFDVLVDTRNAQILYSQDRDLIHYIRERKIGSRVHFYPRVRDMSEIMDIVSANHPNPEILFDLVYMDDLDKSHEEYEWKDSYTRMKNSMEKLQRASEVVERVRQNVDLTEQLRKQLEASEAKPYEFKELKPKDTWTKEEKEGKWNGTEW